MKKRKEHIFDRKNIDHRSKILREELPIKEGIKKRITTFEQKNSHIQNTTHKEKSPFQEFSLLHRSQASRYPVNRSIESS